MAQVSSQAATQRVATALSARRTRRWSQAAKLPPHPISQSFLRRTLVALRSVGGRLFQGVGKQRVTYAVSAFEEDRGAHHLECTGTRKRDLHRLNDPARPGTHDVN